MSAATARTRAAGRRVMAAAWPNATLRATPRWGYAAPGPYPPFLSRQAFHASNPASARSAMTQFCQESRSSTLVRADSDAPAAFDARGQVTGEVRAPEGTCAARAESEAQSDRSTRTGNPGEIDE